MIMSETKDNEKRIQLDFVGAVHRHITPLLRTYGFDCTNATPYAVDFRSHGVTLRLAHDKFSYEIEVILAPLADQSQKYGIANLLRFSLGPGHKEQSFFQASSRGSVDKCLMAIRAILEEHGDPVLSGDAVAFEQMRQLVRIDREMYTKEVVQEPVRRAAQEAWKRHEYATVVGLYDSIRDNLTSLEKKRLAYARQHGSPV